MMNRTAASARIAIACALMCTTAATAARTNTTDAKWTMQLLPIKDATDVPDDTRVAIERDVPIGGAPVVIAGRTVNYVGGFDDQGRATTAHIDTGISLSIEAERTPALRIRYVTLLDTVVADAGEGRAVLMPSTRVSSIDTALADAAVDQYTTIGTVGGVHQPKYVVRVRRSAATLTNPIG